MPGPIYTAGRTPLTSAIGAAGGSIVGPPLPKYPSKSRSVIKIQNVVTLVNTFENGSNGTQLTTANTMSGNNVGFDNVSIPSGGTATFTSTSPIRGTLSASLTVGSTIGTTFLEYNSNGKLLSQLSRPLYGRLRVKFPALPSSGSIGFFATLDNGGTFTSEFRIDSTGHILLYSAGATLVATSTTTIAAGQVVDIGIGFSGFTSSSTLECKIYTDITSMTAAETLSTGTANTLQGGVQVRALIGLIMSSNTIQNFTEIFDDIQFSQLEYPQPLVEGLVVTQFGSAAFTADTALIATGTVTQFGSSALTADTTLAATGSIVRNGTAAFTADTALAGTGTVSKLGSASLTVQANQTAAASVTVLGTSAFTIQANQNTTALVTKLPSAALTVQANLNSTSNVTVLPTIPLTIQANLSASAGLTRFGTAALSADTTLVANGIIGGSGASAAFTVQAVMTTTAVVTKFPTAAFTIQANQSVTGLVTELASATLSVQSGMTANGLNTVPSGSIAFNSQSTMVATGTIGSLPVSATLSVQSGLTANGSVTVMPSASLTGQANLTASGRATQFAASGLTATSILNGLGTVTKLGTASLSAQSQLTATGYIALIYFGTAAFTAQSSLDIDANASPPWVLTLIEFSSITIVSGEGSSNKTPSHEGKSMVTAIEGG